MVVNSMECLLCTMWGKMPYAKRYTTPTTVGETEGSLVVGYWVATRQANNGVVVRLCERHMSVVNALDAQEEVRKVAEAAKPVDHTLNPHFQQRLAEVNARKEQLIAAAAAPQPAPPAPPAATPFVLGPGPLPSTNQLVAQPAPVVQQPLTQSAISTGLIPPPQAQPVMNPGLPQAPVENAALIDAPCLFCKTMVLTGEVHNCPMAAARGN